MIRPTLYHEIQTTIHTTNRFENISNLRMEGLKMMVSKQKKGSQNVNFEGLFMSRIYVQGVISNSKIGNPLFLFGDPSGIRTRVTGVRGRRPKPLDDGTMCEIKRILIEKMVFCQTLFPAKLSISNFNNVEMEYICPHRSDQASGCASAVSSAAGRLPLRAPIKK